MAVRLRLALFGTKHAPIFRIVAMDSRKMRDGKYLDNLGTYNPVTGEFVQFHIDRIDEWIKKGAVPSDSVKKLYKRYKKVAPKKEAEEKKAEAAAPVEEKKEEAPVVEKKEEELAEEATEEKAEK